MAAQSRIGVFPGSFDPIHLGHVDLIERSTRLLDELVVAVLNNDAKSPMFEVAERVEMLEELFEQEGLAAKGVRVASFSGLLVDFARSVNAAVVVRGLRSGTDLDYEMPMTYMNRRMHPELDTVFLFPSVDTADLSSSLIKQVAKLGGDPSGSVPPSILRRLLER